MEVGLVIVGYQIFVHKTSVGPSVTEPSWLFAPLLPGCERSSRPTDAGSVRCACATRRMRGQARLGPPFRRNVRDGYLRALCVPPPY
jgi:hypothetical protein